MTRYGNIIKFQGGKAELLPNGFVPLPTATAAWFACGSISLARRSHFAAVKVGAHSGETIVVAELIG